MLTPNSINVNSNINAHNLNLKINNSIILGNQNYNLLRFTNLIIKNDLIDNNTLNKYLNSYF